MRKCPKCVGYKQISTMGCVYKECDRCDGTGEIYDKQADAEQDKVKNPPKRKRQIKMDSIAKARSETSGSDSGEECAMGISESYLSE